MDNWKQAEINKMMMERQAIFAKTDRMIWAGQSRVNGRRSPEFKKLFAELAKLDKKLDKMGWDPATNMPIQRLPWHKRIFGGGRET